MAEDKNLYAELSPALLVAVAVSVAGVIGLLLVDHGPWNRSVVKDPAVIQYANTAGAAKAVGTTVTPTEAEPALEPALGPKPAQPAVPNAPARNG